MNVRFLDFVRACAEFEAAPGDRSCVIAAGVALAIARHLPLPSAPVDAPSNFYNFTNLQAAKDLVAQFNEQIVFNVKEALEETRNNWMLRYNAAHPPRFPVINPEIGYYDNLLGVAKYVDKETHCFNNQYKLPIFLLAQIATQVINEC
jgi:hypothetical protein